MKPILKIQLSALFILFAYVSFAQSGGAGQPVLKSASNNLMQYYISLPVNWNKNRAWPVVIVVEAAEKQFKKNAERFSVARKNLPFIIISPIIVTNGSYGRRDPSLYPYTSETWDKIDAMTDCKFDTEGLIQIAHDVERDYNGEHKFYITGFEAGAHLVWAMVLGHPEILSAAAPVEGNYNGRCVNNAAVPAGTNNLPINIFFGQLSKSGTLNDVLSTQTENAKRLAAEKGFKNISNTVVPGKGHTPLPDEIIAYFLSLSNKNPE